MRKHRLILDYSRIGEDKLHTLAGKVVDCMTDNPLLNDLPFELEDLITAASAYRSRWETTTDGGSSLDNALKNDAKAALVPLLKKLAFYANEVADGNVAILLSTGLHLVATSKALIVPSIPLLVQLTDGRQRGQMVLRFQKVDRASEYEYQYTNILGADNEPEWGDVISTRRTTMNVIAPVIPGEMYYVRVRARNPAGIGDWSATVSLIAR